MVELIPITDYIGVEVRGLDVTQPISSHVFDKIYQAWIDGNILLFRGQKMTSEQQIAFTQQFGKIVSYTRREFAGSEQPEILVLSNITKDGKLIGSPVSGRVWHTDGHYLSQPPIGTMLYAIEVPPHACGGDTLFANTFAAYDQLSHAIRREIDDLQVIISRVQSRPYNYPDRPPLTETELEEWLDVPQPVVLTHSENGRKALYVGGNVPWRIVDMDESDSAPLITFLQELSVLPRFTYRHKWLPGDIIIWDNRSTVHRATPYDQTHRRLMHRTTFSCRNLTNCSSRDSQKDLHRRGNL